MALDNSGSLIVWDLTVWDRLQTIDASFTGPVTSLCWIGLHKNIIQAGQDPAATFAVGFATGMIGIYRKNLDNVRRSAMDSISFPLPSFSSQQVFEFIKIIEAHNRPIEDLAFDRYLL